MSDQDVKQESTAAEGNEAAGTAVAEPTNTQREAVQANHGDEQTGAEAK